MALGAEVVDLVRLHLLDDPDQVRAVGEVAVVEGELGGLALLTPLVWVLVEVIDPAGVERGGAPPDPMHLVALLQVEFRQVFCLSRLILLCIVKPFSTFPDCARTLGKLRHQVG